MKIFEITGTTGTTGTNNAIKGRVTKTSGSEVEIEDPKTPGVKTKIDLDKANVKQEKGVTTIDLKNKKSIGQAKVKPNQNVVVNNPK